MKHNALNTCKHCNRFVWATDEGWGELNWADLNATGDDSIWKFVCDSNDTFTAEHEVMQDSLLTEVKG